jgi:hypothetical protein
MADLQKGFFDLVLDEEGDSQRLSDARSLRPLRCFRPFTFRGSFNADVGNTPGISTGSSSSKT